MSAPYEARRRALPSLLHPFTSLRTQIEEAPAVLVSGRGVWLRDSKGQELLDGFSGLWCVNLGYGREELIDAAARQLLDLPYATTFFNFASEPALRLADRLLSVAPAGLRHVLFTGGGSEAADSAVKIIRHYLTLCGHPQRRHFISLKRGYHGVSTIGTSLTGITACHRFFDAPGPLHHHLPSPYPYRSAYGATDEQIIGGSVEALERKVLELGTRNVAAFFCEPVQGAGGIIVPPRGWLRAMWDACQRLGVLFVADEVITGFCRTGRTFACEWERVEPDIMLVAKGLTSGYVPMGAVLIHERLGDVLASAPPHDRALAHGFTYSGHPVAAAVGLAALDLYACERSAEAACSRGQQLLERLEAMRDLPWIGDVRGCGLLAAVELVRDPQTKARFDATLALSERVRRHAYARGLIVRAFSDDIIGLAPALSVTSDEIDEIATRLRGAIEQACGEVSRS